MIDKQNKTSNWGPTILSIIIGVIVTLGTTWYTIYANKAETTKSENERYSKVTDNLVSIIEEHIVNRDSINIDGFERLITNRTKQEELFKKPSIYDLLTQAEYNIQNSKHLSFDKKLEYSKIISQLYKYVKADTTINLTNNRFPEETKLLLKTFEDTKQNEGKKALVTLVEKYENEINTLQKNKINEDTTLTYLFKSPSRLIWMMSAYIIILFLTMYYIRIRRRRRLQLERYVERKGFEEQKIRDEIENLTSFLNNKSIEKQERKFIEERLEHLFNKLENIENTTPNTRL